MAVTFNARLTPPFLGAVGRVSRLSDLSARSGRFGAACSVQPAFDLIPVMMEPLLHDLVTLYRAGRWDRAHLEPLIQAFGDHYYPWPNSFTIEFTSQMAAGGDGGECTLYEGDDGTRHLVMRIDPECDVAEAGELFCHEMTHGLQFLTPENRLYGCDHHDNLNMHKLHFRFVDKLFAFWSAQAKHSDKRAWTRSTITSNTQFDPFLDRLIEKTLRDPLFDYSSPVSVLSHFYTHTVFEAQANEVGFRARDAFREAMGQPAVHTEIERWIMEHAAARLKTRLLQRGGACPFSA